MALLIRARYLGIIHQVLHRNPVEVRSRNQLIDRMAYRRSISFHTTLEQLQEITLPRGALLFLLVMQHQD